MVKEIQVLTKQWFESIHQKLLVIATSNLVNDTAINSKIN